MLFIVFTLSAEIQQYHKVTRAIDGDAGYKRFKQDSTKIEPIPENQNYENSIHDIQEFAYIH